jgi:hypothetical protein
MLLAVETFLIMLSFKYPPIPAAFDIRLTKLKPYSAERPVRCELVNPSFADKRSYQSLSYAWGKHAEGFKQIYIDEHPFQVGINLYEVFMTSMSQRPSPGRRNEKELEPPPPHFFFEKPCSMNRS